MYRFVRGEKNFEEHLEIWVSFWVMELHQETVLWNLVQHEPSRIRTTIRNGLRRVWLFVVKWRVVYLQQNRNKILVKQKSRINAVRVYRCVLSSDTDVSVR